MICPTMTAPHCLIDVHQSGFLFQAGFVVSRKWLRRSRGQPKGYSETESQEHSKLWRPPLIARVGPSLHFETMSDA
jgi:hypothetical protein